MLLPGTNSRAAYSFKSDLKVLDYGALGLPVIASDVESYRAYGKNDIGGAVKLVPNDPEKWARAILSAISEPGKLRDQGDQLRDWVFRNRRIETSVAEFDAMITQLLLN